MWGGGGLRGGNSESSAPGVAGEDVQPELARLCTLPHVRARPRPTPFSFPPHRLLVVVCESRVLLFDLLTRRTTEVIGSSAGKSGLLEGKVPTCAAFLFQGGPVGVLWRFPHSLASPCIDQPVERGPRLA